MGLTFDRDAYGQTKMKVANQRYSSCHSFSLFSVVSLLSHLSEGDSFGFLVFDDSVEEICHQKPFEKIDNMDKLKEKILAIKPRGGTDLYKAINEGHKMLSK